MVNVPKFVGADDELFAERMLEKGFFPENIPPVFAITNLHEASLGALASGEYISDKPTEACRFNASKRGRQRRVFSMPNPTFMIDSSIFFVSHKVEIDEHLLSTSDSCSYPEFSEDVKGRPIQIATFSEFYRRRRQELSLSRYIVKTDISRFYQSIYTHSIPWALHGKAQSKKDRKVNSEAVFGNRLDWLLRQSQDGQTVGIPVGPDFSRIISEIVGSAIDRKFRSNHGVDAPMLRLVDDMYIGCDNLDEANGLLSGIRDAIRSFELDINENKTTILNASDDLEFFWPVTIRRELNTFSGEYDRSKRTDLIHVLDEILRITNDNRDDGIVKYAIRKIDELEIWDAYWEVLEPFLVRVAINFPHCWDYVARVVAWRARLVDVDAKLWTEVVHRTIRQNGNSGHDSEISWALWLLKELKGPIDQAALELVFKRCGPFAVLLALDVHAGGKAAYKIPREDLLDRLGDQPMLGSNWLLAYEADRQFGLKIKSKNIQGSPFFKQMYDDDVSFYDREAVPTVFDDVDDFSDVKSAIEGSISGYDEEIPDEIIVAIDDDDIAF